MKILKCLIFLLPLVGCTKNQSPTDKFAELGFQPKPPSNQSEVGRYQLVQLGSMRRDQFLLDTKNGSVWRSVCGFGSHGPDCDYAYWQQEDVEGVNIPVEGVLNKIEALASSIKKPQKKAH